MLKPLILAFVLSALCLNVFAEEAKKETTDEKKDKTEKLLPPKEGGSSVGNGAPKTPPKK